MSFIQVLFSPVQDIMSGFQQQMQVGQQVLEKVKSFIPQIQPAWVGKDQKQYEVEILTRMVPKKLEFVAALAGQRLDLSKALDTVKQAAEAANSAVEGLAQVFGGI